MSSYSNRDSFFSVPVPPGDTCWVTLAPTRLHRPCVFKRCRTGCQRIPETSEQIWNGDAMTSAHWQKGSLLPEEQGGGKNNGFGARVENKLLHQIISDCRHESPSQVTHELRADPDLSTTLWWVFFLQELFERRPRFWTVPVWSRFRPGWRDFRLMSSSRSQQSRT